MSEVQDAVWNRPRKREKATPMTSYDQFKAAIESTLRESGELTWTEIRTHAKLPQMFPNNQWVHKLEGDIKLRRKKDANGHHQVELGVDLAVGCHRRTG